MQLNKLIEKIEGEAKLHFNFGDDKTIEHVDIEFFSSRGIENILKGKPILDALVINPRVCGICGHAHLIATVKAIEDCFDDIKVTKKAEILRELTLNFEIIQNHFKWFYLTLMPLLGFKQYVLKATKPSATIAKAIAVIAGQYPHNSYCIPGGVVGDITNFDILKINTILDEVIKYFEQNLVKFNSQELLKCENVKNIFEKEGDLPTVLNILKSKNIKNIGKSHDKFIVFGENSYFKRGKSIHTKLTQNLDEKYINEIQNQNSKAKNALYKDKYYEVGSLSRAMINKTPLIKDAHRRFGDSVTSRIVARVCEIIHLLHHSKELLKEIDINELSYIEPKQNLDELNSNGVGVVEAARGSLIHKIEIEKGFIKDYQIITPTQWNLSNGTKQNPATSQKAMIGLKDTQLAEFVFKTFDVCSVCTTH